MSKRRRYYEPDSVGDDAEEKIHEDADDYKAYEEQILEDALDKMEKVKETKVSKEPRIPTMLNDPERLEKGKRRVKSTRLRLRKEPSRVAGIVSLLEKDTIITVDISYKDPEWDKVIDDDGNLKGYVMKIYVTPYN